MLGSRTKEGVSMAGEAEETDTGPPDVAGHEAGDEVADESRPFDAKQKSTEPKVLRVTLSVRTAVLGTLIAGLLASVGLLTWLYIGAKTKLDDEARQAANSSHAERIALDYAVDAAKINVQDLDTWKKNLVKGTTPELKEKLNGAARAMDQILLPLQWNSTATPLIAKVRSNANGIYVVDSFVGVQTKTVQTPDGVQSTATYSITIDSNHDWQITDVGGITAVVGQK